MDCKRPEIDSGIIYNNISPRAAAKYHVPTFQKINIPTKIL